MLEYGLPLFRVRELLDFPKALPPKRSSVLCHIFFKCAENLEISMIEFERGFVSDVTGILSVIDI